MCVYVSMYIYIYNNIIYIYVYLYIFIHTVQQGSPHTPSQMVPMHTDHHVYAQVAVSARPICCPSPTCNARPALTQRRAGDAIWRLGQVSSTPPPLGSFKEKRNGRNTWSHSCHLDPLGYKRFRFSTANLAIALTPAAHYFSILLK